MKSVILDPSILHISETDWNNNDKRDQFIKHLLESLTTIDQYRIAEIAWNDELETCLWCDHTPPWRKDRDWDIQLMPAINMLLRRNIRFIEIDASQSPCSVQPSMKLVHQNAGYCFLKLMHSFIKSQEETFLCLGLPNIVPTVTQYLFSCACCPLQLIPYLVCCSTDWLKYIDIPNEYWPSNETESGKLFSALSMVRAKKFNAKPFLYKFEFSPRFISGISQTQSDKSRILRQIVKKLILTNQEAARDPTLQDKYLNEQKEYRFRVTKSIRIHYHYGTDGQIYFLSFYDVGQHDEGLR